MCDDVDGGTFRDKFLFHEVDDKHRHGFATIVFLVDETEFIVVLFLIDVFDTVDVIEIYGGDEVL